MRVILPPSEMKREGGDPLRTLEVESLGFEQLRRPRTAALRALTALSRNLSTMSEMLRLGPTQRHEALRNRLVRSSPTLPAIDRYTGVLYEALDTATLSADGRNAAGRTLLVHSALFGLVRAEDLIPAYRLSHDSRLPGLRLGSLWRGPISHALAVSRELTLDLRSEGYAALGPLPSSTDGWFVRVVTDAPGGRKRALNHFNKHGKGAFVRALLEHGEEVHDLGSLLGWASDHDIRLEVGEQRELLLTVEQKTGGLRA